MKKGKTCLFYFWIFIITPYSLTIFDISMCKSICFRVNLRKIRIYFKKYWKNKIISKLKILYFQAQSDFHTVILPMNEKLLRNNANKKSKSKCFSLGFLQMYNNRLTFVWLIDTYLFTFRKIPEILRNTVVYVYIPINRKKNRFFLIFFLEMEGS